MSATAHGPTNTDPVALLFPELDTELAVTRSFLALVPFDHAEWRPHAKSGTLMSVAYHLVQLLDFTSSIATMDELQYDPPAWATPALRDTSDLLALFDTKAGQLRRALAGLEWEQLNGSWKFAMGAHVIVGGQRALMLRHMGINHMVHHRAQLGVYLRMLEVKIPGSYGPSADTMSK
jgi:uncharacterized damage-inducible protein DinB